MRSGHGVKLDLETYVDVLYDCELLLNLVFCDEIYCFYRYYLFDVIKMYVHNLGLFCVA